MSPSFTSAGDGGAASAGTVASISRPLARSDDRILAADSGESSPEPSMDWTSSAVPPMVSWSLSTWSSRGSGAGSRMSLGCPSATVPASGRLAIHHRHRALGRQLLHDLADSLTGDTGRLVHEVPERERLVLLDAEPEPDRHHGRVDVLVRRDQEVELVRHLDRAPLGVLAAGRDLLDVAE